VKRFLLGLMPLILVSCNAYFPHLRVIRANYNVSRGEYQPAIVDYLRAQEVPDYSEWISYNLGTVYHYLGESGAAGNGGRRRGRPGSMISSSARASIEGFFSSSRDATPRRSRSSASPSWSTLRAVPRRPISN
jgi:hypothetical protein